MKIITAFLVCLVWVATADAGRKVVHHHYYGWNPVVASPIVPDDTPTADVAAPAFVQQAPQVMPYRTLERHIYRGGREKHVVRHRF